MRKLNKSERRLRHIENLAAIFKNDVESTKVFFKDLNTIEYQGHRLAEAYCNGEIDSDKWDSEMKIIKAKLSKIIPTDLLKNIYLNGDPRGYFLKIDDDYVRENKLNIETDWGGYGILCPHFEVQS